MQLVWRTRLITSISFNRSTFEIEVSDETV